MVSTFLNECNGKSIHLGLTPKSGIKSTVSVYIITHITNIIYIVCASKCGSKIIERLSVDFEETSSISNCDCMVATILSIALAERLQHNNTTASVRERERKRKRKRGEREIERESARAKGGEQRSAKSD